MSLNVKSLTLNLTLEIGDGVNVEQVTIGFAPWAAPLQIQHWVGSPQEDDTLALLVQRIADCITNNCFGPNTDVTDPNALPRRGSFAHDELSREAEHTGDEKEQDGLLETKTKALTNRAAELAK